MNFNTWAETFEESAQGRKALEAFRNHLTEADSLEDLSLYEKILKDRILRACYHAVVFKDTVVSKKGEGGQDNLRDVDAALSAAKRLKNFFQDYPKAGNQVMLDAVSELGKENFFLDTGGGKSEPAHRVLSKFMEALEYGLKRYEPPKALAYCFETGCLSFPRPISKKQANAPSDSCIFELATYIRHFLTDPHQPVKPGTPLPKGCKGLSAQNDIIALFVNAALGEQFTSDKVKKRLNWLQKAGAEFVGWHFTE